jgi:CheY-like chemotaxis protein
LLKTVGFETEEAFDGEHAIEMAKSWKPDLIFMDIIMPKMSGDIATDKIKESEWGKHIKIIAISASALDEEKELVMNHGFEYFIPKPFEVNELFMVIGKVLGLEFVYDKETDDVEMASVYEKISEKQEEKKGEVLKQIKKNIIVGDIDAIVETCSELERYDDSLARKIKDLAQNFELGLIDQLLQKEL